jgi:hypothetical protein
MNLPSLPPYINSTTLIYAVLAFAVVWLIRATIRRSRAADSLINIEDLLLGEDGRISKGAFVMIGAFLLTSWLMVYLTVADKMTEAYLGIYVGAWVAPTVAKLFSSNAPPTNVASSTTVITETSSTPVPPVPPTDTPS